MLHIEQIKKDNQKIIIIDTETTGVFNTDEILQLSIIDANGNTILDQYYKPEHHYSWPQAQKVNNISPAMVKNMPTFKEKLPELQKIIDQYEILAGYNFKFDIRMLNNAGLDTSKHQIIDIMQLVTQYIKNEFKKNKDSFMNFENKRLTTVAKKLGFDYSKMPAHNSLTDVFATRHVYDYIVKFTEYGNKYIY